MKNCFIQPGALITHTQFSLNFHFTSTVIPFTMGFNAICLSLTGVSELEREIICNPLRRFWWNPKDGIMGYLPRQHIRLAD